MSDHEPAHAHFWTVAADWLAREGVEKATMMGFPCLRFEGAFFASIEHQGTGLIVKLPRERVAEMIALAEGEPFAPAGRVFREWVRVPFAAAATWPDRIDEAFAFAGGTIR